jgi:hypothetical protein
MDKIYLTLSKADVEYEKRLALVDLFKPTEKFIKIHTDSTATMEQIRGQMARQLWQTLHQNGIALHPDLKKQYLKQETCIWDNSQIVKVEGVDPKNYEKICSKCGYLYDEK